MIISLNDPVGAELKLTGGKGASLTQMACAGLPIPEGFVVSTEAYLSALAETGVDKIIQREMDELNINDSVAAAKASSIIRTAIETLTLPQELEQVIIDSYKRLCPDDGPVAVRSSATAEDLPEASFAGQQDTYLGVVTAEQVLHRVKCCWASCFTDRAIAYRVRHGIKEEQVAGAVVVQKLIEADKAGVMFTVNPITKGQEVVIEACWGLGEALVSGEVTPDQYIVDKSTGSTINVSVLPKLQMIVRSEKEVKHLPVPADKVRAQVLNNNELSRLNEVAGNLEQFFGAPQDVEWAIKLGKVYLLQSRPVTTM
ncbi:PEP/pyruvate-binding domain-containing protein [Peribacillus sp. SCS-155]|uniref:PEP/pyruvate-binding domain-containing protein n=1 Tax=Peribacillus sedimenti TaxID=3115297 RepID=UPI003905F349